MLCPYSDATGQVYTTVRPSDFVPRDIMPSGSIPSNLILPEYESMKEEMTEAPYVADTLVPITSIPGIPSIPDAPTIIPEFYSMPVKLEEHKMVLTVPATPIIPSIPITQEEVRRKARKEIHFQYKSIAPSRSRNMLWLVWGILLLGLMSGRRRR